MKYIKSQKGITIIVLVITIIILLIIASISLYWGTNSITQAKDTKLEAELKMMQQAILETYTKNKVQAQVVKQDLPGEKISDYDEVKEEVDSGTVNKLKIKDYDNIDNYSYYYKFNTKEQFKLIGVEESNNSYIVNYQTGEVINITTPKKSDGTILYLSK